MGNNRQQAFRELITSVESDLIAAVWRILRDGDDADDAYQQTLVKLWKRYPSVMRHPNPHAFALRVATNTALDLYRKRHRVRTIPIDDTPNNVLAVSPAAEPGHNDTHRAIMDAIAVLPGKQAEATLMRFVDKCPYPDIALVLGCSEATVRKHIQRARDKLRMQFAHLVKSTTTEV